MVGFANWAPWRPKDGYRHTVEDSVYLVAGHQGRGIGAELLRTLIAGASESGAHVMMACIEATNAPSVALHARQGFEVVGTAREVGQQIRPLARPDHDATGPVTLEDRLRASCSRRRRRGRGPCHG